MIKYLAGNSFCFALVTVAALSCGCTQKQSFDLVGPQPWLPSGEQATCTVVMTSQTFLAKTYVSDALDWSDSDNGRRIAVDQVATEIRNFLELTAKWKPPEIREVIGTDLSSATPQELKLKALWREVNEQSHVLKGEDRKSIVSHRYEVCRIIVGIDPIVVIESSIATDSEPGPVRILRSTPVEDSIVLMSYGLDFGHRVPVGSRMHWFSPSLGVVDEPIVLNAEGRGQLRAGSHDFDLAIDNGWMTVIPDASSIK